MYPKKTASPVGCVRTSQAGTKLDRTQTAVKLLLIGMHVINCIMELPNTNKQRRMTSLLELVVFLAPPLRPDADRPCALRLVGAASTVELM